ncbi:MAG: RHS repeat-associated core domain-containing protein [Opitutaceae bacterium]|nr:RHS repeat-associated core domain-containing protein [Opitutaceae bacterium]
MKITGVKNLVGAGGEDAVTEITRSAFVPETPEAFSYDTDGNLLADARWTYTWDAENRLVAMEVTSTAVTAGVAKQKLEFAYDGQSRRVSKKVYSWSGSAWLLESSLLFLYDGWNLIAELDALDSNAAVRTYVWGTDLSGSLQGAGGVGGLLFAYLGSDAHGAEFDGNGNVIGYVDMATGAKSATYEYGAFGEILIADGMSAEAMPFRFSTKYTDNETGLLYYGLRYYSPGMGRWLSKDPIEEEGGTSLYAFVSNNPVTQFDSLGLYEIDVHYYLTLWLASKIKCLPESDATAIASADQGVDENPATSPGLGNTERQRNVNTKYHALHAAPQGGPSDAYMETLRSKAFSSCDPADLGVYLHYLQDTFSHRGFTDPTTGHGKAGHNPDKTANDVSRAYRMAEATLDALIAWSKSCKKCCESSSATAANSLSKPEIGDLFQFLKSPGGGFSTEIGEDDLAAKLKILNLQKR